MIKSIVEHDNLVVRNLQITQGYYRLSQAMRKLIGSRNASWCAFATHASKTAGQALRHELMPGSLKSLMVRRAGFENTYFFFNEVLRKSAKPVDRRPATLVGAALERVSVLISRGNVLVFEELAWPFTSFANAFSGDWDRDEGKFQAFLRERFRPGSLAVGGQDHLIAAFTAYYQARFETERKRKAELVLQGNLLVGLHEQTRLQPYIEQALAAPYDVFFAAEADNAAVGRKENLTREVVTRAVTRMLMSITLPNRELRLGEDVIAPTGIQSFPSDLRTIDDPYCRRLVESFDRQRDTLSGSAAANWTSLDDRMSFVVDFFRCYQQYKRMFEAPFLESQVGAIDAGHLPAGPL
jgi:hypothetical protein